MSAAYGKDEIAALQEKAKRHLWLHFTRMSSYADADIPLIVRGEGPYVYDQHGKRYLDGLAGLFVSQIGHGRSDVAEAGARQASETRTVYGTSGPARRSPCVGARDEAGAQCTSSPINLYRCKLPS